MNPEVYAKEFRRQAATFRSLSKVMRIGKPNSKQLLNATIAEGLAEVCDGLAARTEAEVDE